MLFSKPKKAIGLDVGSHSVKAVQLSRSGGKWCVDESGYALLDRNQLNSDPVLAHANAIRQAVFPMLLNQALVVGALAGQTVVIRYPRITLKGKDSIEAEVQREAGQNIPFDLSEVTLDWHTLEETGEGDQRQLRILLVAAKHEVISSRVQIFQAADVQCGVLGVDSLALADAAEACGFLRSNETVALINIGMTAASIHFVKDGRSNFIRDVSWGARELIQAIAKDRRCDFEEAQKQLQETGREEMPVAEERPAPAMPEASSAESSPNPFGEPGGSLLDPLDEELGGLGEVSAPAKSPFAGETSTRSIREVLSAPLARMVSEIRRSFDFFEHQLYERPVERIILSGGAAHLPLVGETLSEELGVETVEVADPATSELILSDEPSLAALREHPAQFLVAIGLAARGMADL